MLGLNAFKNELFRIVVGQRRQTTKQTTQDGRQDFEMNEWLLPPIILDCFLVRVAHCLQMSSGSDLSMGMLVVSVNILDLLHH